jgi:hypothetical protein
LELAASIGITTTEFWDMTPFELNIYAENYANKMRDDIEEKITLAYLNSLWTVQWQGKKHQQPRPLKEILASIGKEKNEMTDEQMLEKVKALNAMFGGEVKGIGKK